MYVTPECNSFWTREIASFNTVLGLISLKRMVYLNEHPRSFILDDKEKRH